MTGEGPDLEFRVLGLVQGPALMISIIGPTLGPVLIALARQRSSDDTPPLLSPACS